MLILDLPFSRDSHENNENLPSRILARIAVQKKCKKWKNNVVLVKVVCCSMKPSTTLRTNLLCMLVNKRGEKEIRKFGQKWHPVHYCALIFVPGYKHAHNMSCNIYNWWRPQVHVHNLHIPWVGVSPPSSKKALATMETKVHYYMYRGTNIYIYAYVL